LKNLGLEEYPSLEPLQTSGKMMLKRLPNSRRPIENRSVFNHRPILLWAVKFFNFFIDPKPEK
jgi:hypothetical protein